MNFHTLAVEDKNIYFTFFFKHYCYGCKMAVLRRITFHSMFWNFHSFELMLGSSRPEVFCKKGYF